MNNNLTTFEDYCEKLKKSNIAAIFEKIIRAEKSIPTKEIWNYSTIDTILSLIEFYDKSGAFKNKETPIKLLDQLDKLVDNINQRTLAAYKDVGKKTPFSIYLCSVDIENTFMIKRIGKKFSCCIRFNTISSLTSTNELICQNLQKIFDDLSLKSVQICGSSATERYRFFQTLTNKVEDFRVKMGYTNK